MNINKNKHLECYKYIVENKLICKNNYLSVNFDDNFNKYIKSTLLKINDFDFVNEPCRDISSDFWKDSKRAKVKGEKVSIQNTCDVAIDENNNCIGIFNKSTHKMIDVDELSKPIKEWIKGCNIKIDINSDSD